MLQLYHNHKSTCSQKVRICLAEMGLEYESHHIDLSTGEHLTPAYLAINPNGVVPALVVDGRPVIESTVICEYLAEAFPGRAALVPEDAVDRAWMRAWLRYIDEVPSMAVRVPTFNRILHIYEHMSPAEFEAYAAKMPLRKYFFLRMGQGGFSRFETDAALDQLGQTIERIDRALAAGPWLMGAQYTIADICLLPVFVRMEDLGIAAMWRDRSRRVEDWYRRQLARPSFAAAYYEGARMEFPPLAARPARAANG